MEQKKPGIYRRDSRWFENAWKKVQSMHEQFSQTSTPDEMQSEHAAFLAGLRAQMLEKGLIKIAQLDRLHEIYKQYNRQRE